MLLYILLPLLISWLFKKFKFKRNYLTYVVSGGIVLLIPGTLFLIGFLTTETPDLSAIAFDKGVLVALIGNLGWALFFVLFFQYIFNKTMGLNKKQSSF